MRKFALIAALLGAIVPLTLQSASAATTFAPHTVAFAKFTAEPSIAVDSTTVNPTLYYTAPGLGNIWKSTDHGSSWTPGAGVSDQGDSDVAIDGSGRVYVVGLLSDGGGLSTTVPYKVLAQGGTSVLRSGALVPNAGTGIACDRQWVAAEANGHAVVTASCNSFVAWVTNNAGATWSGPFSIAGGYTSHGPITFAPDHSMWTIYGTSRNGLHWARSVDGQTWTSGLIDAAGDDNISFPVLDVDDAGNVYAVWGDNRVNGESVYFSRSINGGSTWSAAQQLSTTTLSPLFAKTASTVFPWVTAGAAGKLDVVWFQARDALSGDGDFSSDLGLPTTKWDIMLTQSLTGVAGQPTFSAPEAIVQNFHTGSICTSGLACLGPQNLGFGNAPTPFDRRLLDFFETDIDAAGNLYVAYAQDRPLKPATSNSVFSATDLMVGVQSGGSPLR